MIPHYKRAFIMIAFFPKACSFYLWVYVRLEVGKRRKRVRKIRVHAAQYDLFKVNFLYSYSTRFALVDSPGGSCLARNELIINARFIIVIILLDEDFTQRVNRDVNDFKFHAMGGGIAFVGFAWR